MHPSLSKVLVSEEKIAERVAELGRELTQSYEGKELTFVALLNGALFFTADLIRETDLASRLECLRVSSYGDGTTSNGAPRLTGAEGMDLKGRHVLLVDDILDTGHTLSKVARLLSSHEPASLRTCVLLEKHGRKQVQFQPDFVGFHIPDEFVVGYGLDYAQRYRNLRCIGVLSAEAIKAG